MLYESAGMADSLCRLNDWERCSIPIRSLEIGLKHRQLDTVSFFLKSRENGLCLFSCSNLNIIASLPKTALTQTQPYDVIYPQTDHSLDI